MKKLILIPSLAIATTLPALTAVSCGSNWTSQWNLNDGEFVWKHDQPVLQFDTKVQLNEGYYARIDKKILADDIISFMADRIWSDKDLFESAEIKVRINKIDKVNKLMSFDVWMKRKSKAGIERGSGQADISYKNMPFILERQSINIKGEWELMLNHVDGDPEKWILLDWYKNNKQWSCTVKVTSGDQNVEGTINYKSLDDVEKYQQIINKMCSVRCISYFFENVTVGKTRV